MTTFIKDKKIDEVDTLKRRRNFKLPVKKNTVVSIPKWVAKKGVESSAGLLTRQQDC